ncbi:cell division protein ZapD [Ideonella sp. 4Y11]|uniref:Cell division protein ZapD n=1 Tax=Ideonella aquatica TaxID=2824119 RepID=A0A940YFY6_9BURK|nr:cell division protein ZapD [Ideonella aquatica]MBQ0958022.1 cell division protein ZapD [Ideonella aquatica]
MVLYEYPFNEGIRTMLRLEQLFGRLAVLAARTEAIDHHFALATMFEIMDVAARADLKSDLLKELERHKAQFQSYRGNPHVSEAALDEVVGRIDQAFQALNAVAGKAGQALSGNDWLTSVRSRISIPGGTCSFDLPGYYAWQQHPAERRQADLGRWLDTLQPLADALRLLLGLLRDSGVPHRVVAQAGQYQQSLPQGRTYQLLRLRLDTEVDIVPEITGHRLMVSVRLMRADADGRLRPLAQDVDFDLALCT